MAQINQVGVTTGTEHGLSDIDDTLVRSLCDERYQPKTVIPGVLSFIARCPSASGPAVAPPSSPVK